MLHPPPPNFLPQKTILNVKFDFVVVCFQLMFSCKWLSPVVTADLSCSFHRPFSVRHVLHSSETKWAKQSVLSCLLCLFVCLFVFAIPWWEWQRLTVVREKCSTTAIRGTRGLKSVVVAWVREQIVRLEEQQLMFCELNDWRFRIWRDGGLTLEGKPYGEPCAFVIAFVKGKVLDKF